MLPDALSISGVLKLFLWLMEFHDRFDPARKLMPKHLIAEIYDHLTGKTALINAHKIAGFSKSTMNGLRRRRTCAAR